MLLPIAAVAGMGNSVFHPADYSMLNATVSPRWIARAYSMHGFSENIGWVLAPALIAPVTYVAGWRVALLTAAGVAVVATFVIARLTPGLGQPMPAVAGEKRTPLRADIRALMAAPILIAFGYFALLSGAFTPPAFSPAASSPIGSGTTRRSRSAASCARRCSCS